MVSLKFPRINKLLSLSVLILGIMALSSTGIRAEELPQASNSPLVGFNFEDKPLSLPIQSNFQNALQTASKEIGRSCSDMEAYGWKMKQTEQVRVNRIFTTTVDRLRGLGYIVESKSPNSLATDVTLFTADRPEKHFIFMWSAGEVGLVMVLCESTPPANATKSTSLAPLLQPYSQQEVVKSRLIMPEPVKELPLSVEKFLPVGNWVGSYTCAQGFTGGELQITHLKGKNFDGLFRFYPTVKNPHIPRGSYKVTGQYDRDTQRILINPRAWIKRPRNYYNTVMVGVFDPVTQSFSAYFQGITGCTSFEARREDKNHGAQAKKSKRTHHKHKAASKTSAPASNAAAQSSGLNIVPDYTKSPAPTVTPPAPAAQAVPQPVVPSVALPSPTPPAPAPASSSALPSPPPPASSIIMPSTGPTPQP